VAGRATRDWLRALEREEPLQQWALLCFLAGREVDVDEDERNASLRRAELLLASGGDPRRSPELYGRPVTAVAADLDAPERRAALRRALEALGPEVSGLRGAGEALRVLLGDADLAWQAYAYAVLAERLAGDEA
jgi:hypothetical protein